MITFIIIVVFIGALILFLGNHKFTSREQYLEKKNFIQVNIKSFVSEYKGFIPRETMDLIQKAILAGKQNILIKRSDLLNIQYKKEEMYNKRKENSFSKLSVIILLISVLCSCGSNNPSIPDIDYEYPHTIATGEECNRAYIPEKGSDPVVVLGIRRAASDSIVSYEWKINGSNYKPVKDSSVIGKTWDRDDIIPEGVTDIYTAPIKGEGEVKVQIVAIGKSGKVYNNSITYTNDGKY